MSIFFLLSSSFWLWVDRWMRMWLTDIWTDAQIFHPIFLKNHDQDESDHGDVSVCDDSLQIWIWMTHLHHHRCVFVWFWINRNRDGWIDFVWRTYDGCQRKYLIRFHTGTYIIYSNGIFFVHRFSNSTRTRPPKQKKEKRRKKGKIKTENHNSERERERGLCAERAINRSIRQIPSTTSFCCVAHEDWPFTEQITSSVLLFFLWRVYTASFLLHKQNK